MAMNRRMAAGTLSAIDPGAGTIDITGSAQTLDPTGRAILVETAGTITGRLLDDTADHTFTLPVGLWHLAFKSITSVSTLTGKIIL